MTSALLNPVVAGVHQALTGRTDEASTVTPDLVVDAIWLAARLPAKPVAPPPAGSPDGPTVVTRPAPSGPTPAPSTAARPDRRSTRPAYLPGRSDPAVTHRRGTTVGIPTPPPLTEALALARTLRPLRTRRPARRRGRVDEVVTADQAGRTGTWHPIIRPDLERWPDATVVVDTTPTMAIWREQLHAFIDLLAQVGAFRTLQVCQLDVAADDRTPRTRPWSSRQTGADGLVRDRPALPMLRDPTGRRLVLVLTDGMDSAWGDGTYHRLLSGVADTNPVLVVSLVPDWLWPRHGLQVRQARIRLDSALLPNTRWRQSPVDPSPPAPHDVPIPVTDLTVWRLGHYLQALAAIPGPVRVRLLSPAAAPATDRPDGRRTAVEAGTAAQVAASFRSRISSGAYQLLLALAVIPDLLEMGIIRQVQSRLLPQTGRTELAEVLYCGQIVAADDASAANPVFAFADPAVQEALAEAADPLLRAAVTRSFRSATPVTGGRNRLVVPDAHGSSVPARRTGPTPVEVPGNPPVPPVSTQVWELVGGVEPQRRQRARELTAALAPTAPPLVHLAVPGLDGSGHRIAELAELFGPGTPYRPPLFLDHVDRIGAASPLRRHLRDLLGAATDGHGPAVIVFGRDGRGDDRSGIGGGLAGDIVHGGLPAQLTVPGNFRTLLVRAAQGRYAPSAWQARTVWRRFDLATDDVIAGRGYRLVASSLGELPVATQDALWSALVRSRALVRLAQWRRYAAYLALAAEITGRWRNRVGFASPGPVEAVDVPTDVDALLRKRI